MNKKQAEEILQWDVRSWSVALKYWDANIDWSRVGNAIEIGGRQGGLSLWLALKGIHVICSDLENIQITATPLHSKYGDEVRKLITYQNINAVDIPYENHFDLVIFKSIIGGIGRKDNPDAQQQVFDQIYKALKPGGKLLFAENMTASPLHRKTREMFTDWKDYWRYVSMKEMENYLGGFSSSTIKFTGILGAFGRNERQKDLLAKIDQGVLNKLSPSSWKYIAYGIAVK